MRCGIVAIVGRANAGKSTLMNRLLDEKVSIVSPVPQTTRNMVRGILTEPRGQLVFLDTPGVHKATHDLGHLMNRTARHSVKGCDIALLVCDGSSAPREEDDGWMRKLRKGEEEWLLALNKADTGAPHAADYDAIEAAAAADDPAGRGPALRLRVSAMTGAGVPELVSALFERVPEGPLLFPEDILTDFPRNLAIADVVRECLFARLHDEIPHAVAVRVDKFTERGDEWLVDAFVYVNKPSQKPIVLGRRGELLKEVTAEAEKQLSGMYERRVRLFLWVKVEPGWAKNFWLLKQMGYA